VTLRAFYGLSVVWVSVVAVFVAMMLRDGTVPASLGIKLGLMAALGPIGAAGGIFYLINWSSHPEDQ